LGSIPNHPAANDFHVLKPQLTKVRIVNLVVNHPHGLAIHETPYPSIALCFSPPLGSELPKTSHILDAANGECYPEFWIFLADDVPPFLFHNDRRAIPEHRYNAGLII
jgi:hypothetical protein